MTNPDPEENSIRKKILQGHRPAARPQPIIEESVASEGEGEDDAVIGRAFRISLVVLIVALLAGGGGLYAYLRPKLTPSSAKPEVVLPKARDKTTAALVPKVTFSDITEKSGIHFVPTNGAVGEKLLPETMGNGCAFLDYDNDGDQDLLLINSKPWTEGDAAPRPTTVLYRNTGKGMFEDATADSGIGAVLYGTGVAVGDYDNDGWADVFISTIGSNRLFHNAQGKFEDVTSAAGVGGAPNDWSTSCGWFDFDNDGDLDLFVCHYLQWSRDIDISLDCRLVGVGRAYCRPDAFQGTFPSLYRNDGNGKFEDLSESSGVRVKNPNTGVPLAKSLGVTFVDLDQDGWMDIIVANDTVQNLVFHNQKDGKFAEIGALCGVAFDSAGNARGAMGIDVARFRQDETLGIVIGNFANEMIALYCSRKNQLQFSDDAIATGIGPPSRLLLKFGVFFFDYDLDGRLDILSVNGHLEDDIHKVEQSQEYRQPPQLYWNSGSTAGTEFVKVSETECGAAFVKPLVGRSAAFADIDGDGDLDVILTAVASSPRLLLNEQQLGHHWLRVKLKGKACNRDAIGAWVDVVVDGKTISQQVMPTRSYQSQVELPVTFGLGTTSKIDKVVVHWPHGSNQELNDVKVDQLLTIEQQP